MKQSSHNRLHRRHRERGSAMLIVLTLLMIIILLEAGNIVWLHTLQQELVRIDRDQQQRLAQQVASPPSSVSPRSATGMGR